MASDARAVVYNLRDANPVAVPTIPEILKLRFRLDPRSAFEVDCVDVVLEDLKFSAI